MTCIASVALCAACTSAPCDASSIAAALAAAEPGDVVEVGACEIRGALTVPAGVTLRGAGTAQTVVRSEAGVGVTLEGGAALEHLRVSSSGCAAVVAWGPGEARLSSVEISAPRGIGIAAEDIDRLTLEDVAVRGALADGSTPSALPLPPFTCASADPATHGIVLVDVADASLTGVTTDGFAAFGLLSVRSRIMWIGGGAGENIGTGAAVFQGSAELADVSLVRSRDETFAVESFNGLFVDAEVATERAEIRDGAAFGLLHVASPATHTDLVVRDNDFAGLWSQDAEMLEVRGAGTRFSANAFAGIAAVRVDSLTVGDATIEDTRESVSFVGETGAVRAGDGLHLIEPRAATITDLTLAANARIGMLVELAGGSTAGLALTRIQVEGTGAQLGAVAQNGTLVPGWDDEVERRGDTAANDLALRTPLDITGAVGPSCLPDLSSLAADGVAGLLR